MVDELSVLLPFRHVCAVRDRKAAALDCSLVFARKLEITRGGASALRIIRAIGQQLLLKERPFQTFCAVLLSPTDIPLGHFETNAALATFSTTGGGNDVRMRTRSSCGY